MQSQNIDTSAQMYHHINLGVLLPLQGGHAVPTERPTLSGVALQRARQAAAAAAGSCARPQHPTLQRSASAGVRAVTQMPRLPAAPPSLPPGTLPEFVFTDLG
jgi:hypothetical protein